MPSSHPADQLTLAISGYKGRSRAIATVLGDWFDFIGSRPAEVIYIDGGSPRPTTKALTTLLNSGLIDKLQLINPKSWENSFERCYIQEYQSGNLATQPYILFIKPDMLPFRSGHDDWLAQDIAALESPDTFAITTTHLIDPPTQRDDTYQNHDFASLNFTLMKRDSFHEAMTEQAGDFINSNFRGTYPDNIDCEPQYRRALLEWAWQGHCREHGKHTQARIESIDWTIYHINKLDGKLLSYRKAYRARRGVEKYFNEPKALYRPPLGAISQFGRSIENAIRSLKRRERAAN